MISRLPPPRSKQTAGAGSIVTAARIAVKISRASSSPSITSASTPASVAIRSSTSSPLLAVRSALVAQAKISVAPAASAINRKRRIVATAASAASGVTIPSRLTTSPSRSISFSPETGVKLPSGWTSAMTRWNELDPRSTAATRIGDQVTGGPRPPRTIARAAAKRRHSSGASRSCAGVGCPERTSSGGERMTVTGEHRMLIDGELTDAASGATYANINPATEAVDRPGCGRRRRGRGACDHRRPAGLRRDRVGHRRRVPQALPASAPRGAEQGAGDAPAADRRRGRGAHHAHLRGADGQLHRRHGMGHRVHRPGRVVLRPARSTSSSACAAAAGSCGSRSASSARSRRGTSRSCSTCRRSSRRWRPGTRSS